MRRAGTIRIGQTSRRCAAPHCRPRITCFPIWRLPRDALPCAPSCLASVPLFLLSAVNPMAVKNAPTDNALYGVLHDIANDGQSAFEFRELMVRKPGSDVATPSPRIERNARGQVTARSRCCRATSALTGSPPGGCAIAGTTARAPTRCCRTTCCTSAPRPMTASWASHRSAWPPARCRSALAHQETASSLSRNSLRPAGMVSWPQTLTQAQMDEFRKQADQRLAGPGRPAGCSSPPAARNSRPSVSVPKTPSFSKPASSPTRTLRASSACRRPASVASPTRRPIQHRAGRPGAGAERARPARRAHRDRHGALAC